MFNKSNREAAIIAVSIAEVRPKKPNQGQSSTQGNQNKGKKPMMQIRQGRINFTTLAELPDGAPVMSGTFSIHHKPVVILFDSGATHSFISNNLVTTVVPG
jgi:hypothetical protein